MRNPDSDVLTSWQAIAAYLGKGVRTVQRWEVELGLPVRRPYKGGRGTVIALCSELDEWLRDLGTQVTRDHNKARRKHADNKPHERTLPLLRTAVERTLRGHKLLSDLRSTRLANQKLLRDVGQQRVIARKGVDAISRALKSRGDSGMPPPPRIECRARTRE